MDQCMSFNIDKEDYRTFINNLGKLLPQSRKHGYISFKPHLGPLSWLDVELIADDDYRITLRLDSRTLYVRGYCKNCDTHFWEFYDDDSPLIPRSQSLTYSGSYAGEFSIANVVPEHIPLEYQPLLGLTDIARIERHNLVLGYHVLRDAIITQAVMEEPSSYRALSARSLLIMIQIITEAARIKLIGEHMVKNWCNPLPITPRMKELENVWGTPCSHDVTNSSYMRTLVSIEYVCLKTINGESPVELHGTVMVEYCMGKHVVYEWSLDNAESKGPGDYISLTGPSTSVYGVDLFIIKVSLWDHDNEIAKGDVVWEPRRIVWNDQPLVGFEPLKFDVPMVKDVVGECGSVSVAYSVLRRALNATIAVVLINGDRESPANVYGTIKAMIEGSPYQSRRTLFDKSEDEYVQVCCQEFIPLTRPVFPAPVIPT